MASSSLTKYLVYMTAISLIHLDMTTAQSVKWNKDNRVSCLLEGVDNLVLRATISRKGYSSFIATQAWFEISNTVENNAIIIQSCVVSNLTNRCEKYYPTPECYCEYNSTDNLVIVYNTTADSSFTRKKVTVKVSCIEKENATRDDITVHSIFKTTTPPLLYLNDKIQPLSSQMLHSKLPSVIKFCCSDNTSNQFASDCQAKMSRNYQSIDSTGRCVSSTEHSLKYSVYEMTSNMCNKTLMKIDIIFFPTQEETNDIERESFSFRKLCFSDGLCVSIVVIFYISAAVVIAVSAMNLALMKKIWCLINRKEDKKETKTIEPFLPEKDSSQESKLAPGKDRVKYRKYEPQSPHRSSESAFIYVHDISTSAV